MFFQGCELLLINPISLDLVLKYEFDFCFEIFIKKLLLLENFNILLIVDKSLARIYVQNL